jgi:glycolate oxidase
MSAMPTVAAKQRPQAVVVSHEYSASRRCGEMRQSPQRDNRAARCGNRLAGGSLAETDSLMLSLTRMNQIVEIDIPNRCALVKPAWSTFT